VTFEGCEIGRVVGRACDATPRRKSRAALQMFTHHTLPGRMVTKNVWG
jgi:hypothetical protein